MSPSYTLSDAEARNRILSDLKSNFFVEAGAGSGKTTALVNRMAAMVESGIDITAITAITFTVAASREFYKRFQERLIADSRDETLSPKIRGRAAAAQQKMDMCFLGTIDSFCALILGEHPMDAAIPTTLNAVNGEDATAVFNREIIALRHGEYGGELSALYHRFAATRRNADGALLAATEMIMKAHGARWITGEVAEADPGVLFARERADLIQLMEVLNAHPEYMNQTSRKADRDLAENLPGLLRTFRRTNWSLHFGDVSQAVGQLAKLRLLLPPDKAGILRPDWFEETGTRTKYYTFTPESLPALRDRMNELDYSLLMDLAVPFCKEMAGRLRKNGELTFYDNLLYLRDMLRKDAAEGGSLIRHIRKRHRYFLLDEFQDTNPLQSQVFFYLSSDEPDPDWRRCRPTPGSLFIVGDPKQSIYRFRGADVRQYLAVKELFVPPVGEVLTLSTNFRSNGDMRRWFNRAFSELLPDDTRDQRAFTEIPPREGEEKKGTLSGTFVYKTANKNEAYAYDTAALIRRVTEDPDCTIQSKGDKAPRRVRYDDIMVITVGGRGLRPCMDAFHRLGIPYRVEGKTDFAGCPALRALTDILSAVAFSSDPFRVYRGLRSDVFPLGDAELAEWRQKTGRRLTLYVPEDAEEDDPVTIAMTRLKAFEKETRGLSARAVCERILSDFELFRLFGTGNAEYVWYALELLSTAQSGGDILSLKDASAFMDKLATDQSGLERSLKLTADENRVHIANLHKVKGLEAPVVILSQVKRTTPGVNVTIDYEDGEEIRRGIAIKPEEGFNIIASTRRFQEEAEEEQGKLDAERLRLLYVAATRAGCALFIPSVPRDDRQDPENYWGDLAFRCDRETVPPMTEEVRPEFIRDETAWDGGALRERLITERATYTLIRPSEAKVASDLFFDSGDFDTQDEKETVMFAAANPEDAPDTEVEPLNMEDRIEPGAPRAAQSSALLGTLVHRVMEVLVNSRNRVGKADLLTLLEGEYNLESKENPEELRNKVARVYDRITSGGYPQEYSGNRPVDILAKLLSADEVRCEVPFCLRREEQGETQILNGVIDALYREGDTWHILDYKTDTDANDLMGRHGPQLACYQAALKQCLGLDAGVEIYHIPVECVSGDGSH